MTDKLKNIFGYIRFLGLKISPCNLLLSGGHNYFNKNVKIGNNVLLGAKVTVLKGVTIGEGVIVGANSVVTKDLPAFSICGGIPAKVIKMRNSPQPPL